MIKTQYVVNGKVFANEEAAVKYDKKIEEEKIKKELLEKEKKDRIKELQDSLNNYLDLKKKFDEDYPVEYDWSKFFKLFFN